MTFTKYVAATTRFRSALNPPKQVRTKLAAVAVAGSSRLWREAQGHTHLHADPHAHSPIYQSTNRPKTTLTHSPKTQRLPPRSRPSPARTPTSRPTSQAFISSTLLSFRPAMVRYCEQCLLYSAVEPPTPPTESPAPPAEPAPLPVMRVNMVDVLADKTADGAPAGPRNFVLATTSRKTIDFGTLDDKEPGSLWTTAPDVETELSEESLAELQANFTKSLRRAAPRGSSSTVSLITGVKAFALTLLIKFPDFPDFPDDASGRIDGWIAALLEIKFQNGGADTIDQMLASWPTADQLATVKAFRGSPDSLKLVDRFFYELRGIPLLHDKFTTLHLYASLDQRADWIKKTVDSVVDAVSELLASSSFRRAVISIQKYAHRMNTGDTMTHEQSRKGFPIGHLTKILEVTSYFRATPMLEVLIRSFERDCPDISAFPSELPSLPAMATLPLDAALADAKLLERGMKTIDEQLEANLPFRIAPKFVEPLAKHRIVLEEVRSAVAAKMERLRADLARYDKAVVSFDALFGKPAATEFTASIRALGVFAREYRATRQRLFPPPPPPPPPPAATPSPQHQLSEGGGSDEDPEGRLTAADLQASV